MRILHVTEQIYRSSGVSVFCVELCDALFDMGNDVRIALQFPEFRDPYPVKHKKMLISIEEVLARPAEFKWDVVHINGVWNLPYHRISRLAHQHGVPVVWSPHGSLTPWALSHKSLKKKVAWWMYQRRDLKQAQLLHVTAQSEVEDMRRLGLTNDLTVLPLGVVFRWSDAELKAIKDSMAEKKIVFLSRLHPKKGVDNLIRAWRMLKDVEPEIIAGWKVEVIGEDAYPNYGSTLKALCKEMGVSDDFTFRGVVYGDDKERAYASARLFVLPTHSENFGAVVAEALANGTPVVTTKGTPWGGLVEHKCGWWIDVGVEPLLAALKEVVHKDEASLRAMGAAGREWMKRDFDWHRIAWQMAQNYSDLAKQRR